MKTIKLAKKQIEDLELYKNEKDAAEEGFRAACRYLNDNRIYLSKKLKELFPGSNVLHLNWKDWTVEIAE